MLAIEMLPAGHGDALVVEYGSAGRVHRLLIDAGTAHSYEQVRARLLERNDGRYEAFVITHVDEDHIGGAIRLLADRDLRHRIHDVWFNGYAHCERGGDVLGPIDGERLTRAIHDGGYRWNKPFKDPVSPAVGGAIVVPGRGELPTLPLAGGATLTLLSPSGPKLRRMAKVWREVVTAAHLVPGQGTDSEGRVPRPREKAVPALPATLSADELRALARKTRGDGSAANGSSIAFVVENGNARALLAADAHSPTLVAALRRFAQMKGEARVRLDLCKLPHHGSAANVTTALVEAIDTTRYLVSSDGMNFGHPDDAALARLLCSSTAPPRIYCNYASPRTLPWQARAAAAGAEVLMPAGGAQTLRVEVS